MALLTLQQQQEVKPISQNWANYAKLPGGWTNFEQLQAEIEAFELTKLLGNAFLLDLQNNQEEARFIDLLDGLEFEDPKGNTLKFRGIRYQLAYFNYAQYAATSKFSDTFTGLATQTRPEATQISEGEIIKEQNRARAMAMQDFDIMKIFLDLNSANYPLWNCSTNRKNIFTPRWTTVRKTVK